MVSIAENKISYALPFEDCTMHIWPEVSMPLYTVGHKNVPLYFEHNTHAYWWT